MAYGSNLKRRGSIFYARLVVPVELRHLMGTCELLRSLQELLNWGDLRRQHPFMQRPFPSELRPNQGLVLRGSDFVM
jgi:hypothetical protein